MKRGNYKKGFWERFSIYSRDKQDQFKVLKNPTWIHAVSVGETVAALNFIQAWRKEEPDKDFVLSTTTSTGQQIARDHSPDRVILCYFPLDFYFFVRRALQTISPDVIVLFEVEIWPNLILHASWKKVKLALVNCRMSDKSAAGYSRFRWFFEPVFSCFSEICTQSELDAERVRSITGNTISVNVCNTMKFDQLAEFSREEANSIALAAFGETKRVIFTAASTHPGEELILTRIVKILVEEHPNLRFIVIPRHVERTSEIAKILQQHNLSFSLRSELGPDSSASQNKINSKNDRIPRRVLLVNTTGEMMNFLAISDIVFMGNSLGGNKGGHNIIEPAILGKPIITGNGMENFRSVTQKFMDHRACIQVENEAGCLIAIEGLLKNPKELERLGRMSLKTVENNRGAIQKTISILQKV